MPRFETLLAAFGAGEFAAAVKRQLLDNVDLLPLEQALSQGGIVDTRDIEITVLKIDTSDKHIQVCAGVFFREVVGGCSCGDEPYSDNAYCEIRLSVDRRTAVAECSLLET